MTVVPARELLLLLALAPLLGTTACLSGGTPLEVRRIRPVLPERAEATPQVVSDLPLHFEPVRASSSLGEPVIWTRANGETGVYEDLRWIDPPVQWFEQALARALFEEGSFLRARRGDARELQVELIGSHERPDTNEVELLFRWELWEEGTAHEETERVRVALAGDTDAALATAMGEALERAGVMLARKVRERFPE